MLLINLALTLRIFPANNKSQNIGKRRTPNVNWEKMVMPRDCYLFTDLLKRKNMREMNNTLFSHANSNSNETWKPRTKLFTYCPMMMLFRTCCLFPLCVCFLAGVSSSLSYGTLSCCFWQWISFNCAKTAKRGQFSRYF